MDEHKLFTIIAGAILLTALIILAIATYKVRIWLSSEQLQALFKQHSKMREHYKKIPFIKKILAIRSSITIFMCAVVLLFLLIFAFVPSIHYNQELRHASGYALGFTIIASLIANSLAVRKYWRCPYCKKTLPVRVTKAGASPKLTDTCPYCQKSFLDEKETLL